MESEACSIDRLACLTNLVPSDTPSEPFGSWIIQRSSCCAGLWPLWDVSFSCPLNSRHARPRRPFSSSFSSTDDPPKHAPTGVTPSSCLGGRTESTSGRYTRPRTFGDGIRRDDLLHAEPRASSRMAELGKRQRLKAVKSDPLGPTDMQDGWFVPVRFS